MGHFITSALRVTFVTLALSLSACNMPHLRSAEGPTLSVTQAFETVNARLTGTSAVRATVTAVPITKTPQVVTIATPVPSQSPKPNPSDTPPLPTVACDLAAPGNPIDITIPDDTVMSPGEAFTKTWRLQNVGNCTWGRGYRLEHFSGDALGAVTSIPLETSLAPGQTIDLSVDMVAPLAPGKYQGFWKLRNASQNWFGIGSNGGSPFWVRIVVTIPATLTPTRSITPTATSTPAVAVNGTVILEPGTSLDLDRLQANAGSGEDISYEKNTDGKFLLIPQGNVVMAIYKAGQPDFINCQAASMNALPIVVEDLPPSAYLCFRTNLGMPGRAFKIAFNLENGQLTLDILTWKLP